MKSLNFIWELMFVYFFMQVLESVVKNCGQTVHDEVANKQTMEELKELLKVIALRPFFFTVSYTREKP